MIKHIFLLSIVCTFIFNSAFCQVSDDFSDGDFTNNPTWSGDDALFSVNGDFELQSQNASGGTYYLSTPSTLASDAQWEFFINLKFATSGANYVDIYLMSDQANLTAANNAYFLRIGGTPDEISLFKKVGGTNTMIIDGDDGLVNSSSNNPFKIKVTRDLSDNWTILYDKITASTGSYVFGGSVNDASINTSTHFGFLIVQSTAASPINNHYFDDIEVTNIPLDLTPPSVTNVNFTSANTLDVTFDEPVEPVSAETLNNYTVNNGIGNPTIATVDGVNPSLVHLTFGNNFVDGTTYQLTVSNVEDFASNVMTTSNHDFLYFVPAVPALGDIIINELFPDPSPQVGLPNAEYVELYNRSNKTIDLANWTLADPSSTATLPSHILLPGEYVAIAPSSASFEFSIFPNIIFVSSLPTLNNSSDIFTLRDNNGNFIDEVEYFDTWYQDSDKKQGGWSLELINPEHPCPSASNWIASNDPNGGTPGTVNSVFDNTPDITPPSIISTNVLSSIKIEICFSESIDTANVNASMFSITGNPNIAFIEVSEDLSCVTLTTSPALDTGIVYVVNVNGVGDCAGNLINNFNFDAILAAKVMAGDIIINEVLFNPLTGGSDFVEIYNVSDKFLDLNGMFLANFDDGSIDNFKKINEHRLMKPKDFIVITKDSANVKANYMSSVSGTFLHLSSLPTYSNDSSSVYLMLPDSSVCEKFSYNDDMHFSLIKDVKGVSLERIDYNRTAQDETNWHSAAENLGWATPGRENSQYFPNMITGEMIDVYPEIFSPDGDGFEDVLNISYTLDKPGYVANIIIFDRMGRIVRHLIQNDLLSPEGTVTWDGTNNKREKAPIGPYIIYFEIFDEQGNVSAIKKSTVLTSKFN